MRDGFRCMLTGMFDDTSLKRNRELGRLCDGLTGIPSSIQMCRILNGSAMQDIDPTMDSEKSTVINKVCDVTVSRVLRCPPHSHYHPDAVHHRHSGYSQTPRARRSRPRTTLSRWRLGSWEYTLIGCQYPFPIQHLEPVVRGYR